MSHLGNAALHISWAARNRAYDPGSVTAILTLAPVAISGLHHLADDPGTSRRALRLGAAAGVALSAALVPLLKRRLRRGR